MDASALVSRQRQWFARGLTRPLAFRLAALRRLREAVAGGRAMLLDALYADLRRGPYEATSAEVAFVFAEIDFALRNLKRWMRPSRRPAPPLAWPARAAVVAEPLGVALILGPWNYPVQLLLVPLAGAIAAGDCAVLKPSELAPRTSAALAQVIGAAFEPEHVAVVEGERDASEALLRERFDTIFFTGSTEVGKVVMSAAARHLTPVTLELGGKCPCVVCDDADVGLAGRRIAWGKMLNAGQTCVAPDHVLVDRRRRDELLDAVKRSLVQFFGPDPRASPHFGRIVNRRHFDRLVGYLGDADGGTAGTGSIVHGGERDAGDLYLAPTVLADVPPTAPVMREEIFGPILPVETFDGVDDAFARLAGRSDGPLAAYVFTRARATERRFVERVRAGGVCVNDTVVHLFGKHLPFGGVGPSGMGRYHGRDSFETFSHLKTVVRTSGRVDLPWRYPPTRMPLATFERMLTFFLRR
jgi:aldehyde dehydrogenase (NAD+)